MEKRMELLLREAEKQEMGKILDCNGKTIRLGLELTKEETKQLVACEYQTLRECGRVQFTESILPKLIETFCDSAYIQQEEYLETLEELQEIFFFYKNESGDKLSDDELLECMKQQYEKVCHGDLEYLKTTCLAEIVRTL